MAAAPALQFDPSLKPSLLKPFVKTEKQRIACDLLNDHRHTLLYGGSRSAKTTIAVRNVILRAIKMRSRHLITRFRFNHAKVSLWHDTIPKVFRMCFPGLEYQENKQDWFYSIEAADGGESQIWIGGVDDKDRVEKVLGNEYSTIFANECSQISHNAIVMLRTRLAESSGLPLRFYYDCNPPAKTHWTHRVFIEGLNPDKEPHTLDVAHMQMNPVDNAANLSPEYIEELRALPKRARQRFLDGLFLTDVEGALWTDQMVNEANLKAYGEIVATVISVDPSVSDNPGSDACGMAVCSLDEFKDGVVQKDLTKKLSTAKWAQLAVDSYWRYGANAIIAEKNQGGTLVSDAIHNIDRRIPVKLVWAAKGKKARAEPIAQLYELGRVAHAETMVDLEDQYTSWIPNETRESPNNLDAAVWGLTHLMIEEPEPQLFIG